MRSDEQISTTPHQQKILVGLVGLSLPFIILFAAIPSQSGEIVAAGGVGLSFILAMHYCGWRGALVLFCLCSAITFTIENISVATGFPFGQYHFEVGQQLPRIGAIPLIVGPLYFGVGFLAWIIASSILEDADLGLDRRVNLVALPIIASFFMVQWDLVMDATASTIHRAWIWHEGGAYFGVPLSNFFGWFLTVWLVFQTWALAIARFGGLFEIKPGADLANIRVLAIVLYLAIALSQIAPYLVLPDTEMMDASGRIWHASDIRGATIMVMCLTMLPTGLLALILQIKRRATK